MAGGALGGAVAVADLPAGLGVAGGGWELDDPGHAVASCWCFAGGAGEFADGFPERLDYIHQSAAEHAVSTTASTKLVHALVLRLSSARWEFSPYCYDGQDQAIRRGWNGRAGRCAEPAGWGVER
jgi:hypothetical protein